MSSIFSFLVFLTSFQLSHACPLEVPYLRDSTYDVPRNLMGDETSIESYLLSNRDILSRLPLKLPGDSQDEILARLKDNTLRWELRMIYAVVLANQGNLKAQNFLVEQYKNAKDARIPDAMLAIYWAWRLPWIDDNKEANVAAADMAWVEEIMLAALSEKRLCTVDTPLGGDFPVRDLAVHYGRFEMILTAQKSKMAVPVFCKYVMDELSLAPENDLFPDRYYDDGASNIVYSLSKWDDAAVEPVMLEVVRCAIRKRSDEWALSYAMDWLIKRKNDAVIHIAKEGLGLDHVFDSLAGTTHKPYLIEIRNKLPDLKDGNLSGYQLFRQRTHRAHAELILILGENADPVPNLFEFAENIENEARKNAIYALKELKDRRCVSWAEKLAASEQDWFLAFCLIELLDEIPSKDATVALVNLLDLPFDKIEPVEGSNYSAKDYHARIHATLEKRTGKSFGTDSTAWRKWLSEDKNE